MINPSHNIFKKAWLRLCFFSLFSACLYGQTVAQSESETDSLIKIVETYPHDTNTVNALYKLSIGYLYYDKSEASKYAFEALDLSKKLNYKKGKALSYAAIANIGNVYGDYSKAVEFYLKAIEIFEELNDKLTLGKLHGYLGDVYGFIGGNDFNPEINRRSGLKHHLKSIEYLQECDNKPELARAYSSLGNAYVIVDSLDKANYSYNKSLDLLKEYPDIFTSIAANTGIAGVYYKQKKYDDAVAKYQQCLSGIPYSGEFDNNISIILHDMSMSFLELKRYNEAIQALDSSLAISQRIGDVRGIRMAYSGLDNVYYAMGDYKKAYEAFNEWVTLEQDLLSENTQKQINELQEKYESEKKELEITDLNLKNQKLESKIYERNIIIGLSTGIFVLIILLILLYIKHKQTKELKKRSELEHKALRAQMNPHFIFNSLNSIQRMFMEGNFDIANDYMGNFGQLLRIILENSGKSHISVKDEINTLKLYLEIEKMRTDETISYEINVDPKIDILNSYMPPLIIQPFVENAIWHGILPNDSNGKIIIDILKKDEKKLICTITDNGIGINHSLKMKKNDNHISKGMKITRERLNNIHSVIAEELETGGTKITVLIPVTK